MSGHMGFHICEESGPPPPVPLSSSIPKAADMDRVRRDTTRQAIRNEWPPGLHAIRRTRCARYFP